MRHQFCVNPKAHGCGRPKAPENYDWTIVIASTLEIASSVQRYYALLEAPQVVAVTPATMSPLYRFTNFEFTSAANALRVLEGARPDRIIIADYMRWGHHSPLGTTTQVWDAIHRMQAKQKVPAKLVFA